jgi:hypothetical protein
LLAPHWCRAVVLPARGLPPENYEQRKEKKRRQKLNFGEEKPNQNKTIPNQTNKKMQM